MKILQLRSRRNRRSTTYRAVLEHDGRLGKAKVIIPNSDSLTLDQVRELFMGSAEDSLRDYCVTAENELVGIFDRVLDYTADPGCKFLVYRVRSTTGGFSQTLFLVSESRVQEAVELGWNNLSLMAEWRPGIEAYALPELMQ